MTEADAGGTRRTWLERLGIEHAPPDPEAWVPVFSAHVDDANTGFSKDAAAAARTLVEAGIETEQRPYVVPENNASWGQLQPAGNAVDRIRVAVVVRQRDEGRAREALGPQMVLRDLRER